MLDIAQAPCTALASAGPTSQEEFVPFAQWAIPWYNLWLLPLDLSLCTSEKNLSLSSLQPPCRLWKTEISSPPCLSRLFSRPNQPIYLSLAFECHLLQSLTTLVALPLLNSLQFVLIPLVLGKLKAGCSTFHIQPHKKSEIVTSPYCWLCYCSLLCVWS